MQCANLFVQANVKLMLGLSEKLSPEVFELLARIRTSSLATKLHWA